MLGRAHKRTWGLLGIVAAGFCLLALPPVSGADRTHALSGLRADDASLAAKSRSAVLDLYSLDSRLSTAETRLASLQIELHQLRAERASVALQIRLARFDARLSQNRLASRLRFLYDQGNVSTLEVLFGATSLDDAMTQLDDLDRVMAANQNVLLQVRSARSHLLRLSGRLASRERTLGAATREAAATTTELAQTRAARSAYIGELSRRRALDSAQIARLDAEAQAAERQGQRLTQSRATTASPTYSPQRLFVRAAGGRTLNVITTGYDLAGRTSTGLPVGWGVAAVDPSVIPLGTHLTIPGYGEAIAADTGPSVVGTTIDLWFPTAAQAYAWGRRTVAVDVH